MVCSILLPSTPQTRFCPPDSFVLLKSFPCLFKHVCKNGENLVTCMSSCLWVGLSLAKYAVWVVPLALCCQNGCGGQHVIKELQLKFQSLGLFDQVVIPRWLLPSYFAVEPASKLLYANYIHRYCTFHNMLTIICTRCFFSTLSAPNHVDDNTHIPCLLNTTLPVSLCIWNLEGLSVSCIVFLAENSPSVLIFNVDSQPLASSLLSRNCLTLVIMKSVEVNVNCMHICPRAVQINAVEAHENQGSHRSRGSIDKLMSVPRDTHK